MNQQLLHAMAEDAGLSAVELLGPEVQVVRTIQRKAGKEPCFCSDKRLTCNSICPFRSDCRTLVAEWMR